MQVATPAAFPSLTPEQEENEFIHSLALLDDDGVKKDILGSLFTTSGFAQMQLDSYEKFNRHWVQQIIRESPPLVIDSDVTGSRHIIKHGRVCFGKPNYTEAAGGSSPVYPYICKWRGLPYTNALYIDVTHEIYDIRSGKEHPLLVETRHYKELMHGEIPTMRRSSFCNTYQNPYLANECPIDPPGNFIVNGNEKTVVSQFKMKPNAVFIWPCKAKTKTLFMAEIRSCHEGKVRSTSTLTASINAANQVAVTLPFISIGIPLSVIFRALGVVSLEKMMAYILPGRWSFNVGLRNVITEMLSNVIFKDDEVLWNNDCLNNAIDMQEWIGKKGTKEATKEKRIKYVEHILGNEFLPHMGTTRDLETFERKLWMFGNLVRRLAMVRIGLDIPDNRDHIATQRVETIGPLMAYLLRPLFRLQMKHLALRIKNCVDKGKPVNLIELLNTKKITGRFRYGMSTGKWSVANNANGKGAKGVAQSHLRMTVASSMGNLRRIMTLVAKEGKLPKPRQLDLSHWGVLCAYETPEGGSCGLIKNLAMGAHVRVGFDPFLVIEQLLDRCLVIDLLKVASGSESEYGLLRMHGAQCFANGILFGFTSDPHSVVSFVRRQRRLQNLSFDVSVTFHQQRGEVHICTDSGALLRPCFIMENLGRLSMVWYQSGHDPTQLWKNLVAEGVVEYIDKEEEADLRVATTVEEVLAHNFELSSTSGVDGAQQQDLSSKRLVRKESVSEPYTHLEIDPTFIMGVVAAMLPFSNQDQSPRVVLWCAQGKQAVANFALNQHLRPDTVTHDLWNGQRPTVRTIAENLITKGMMPSGLNAKVWILIHTGFTQEDSYCFRRSWIELSAFHSNVRTTHREEEKRKGVDATQIERPDLKTCQGIHDANYSKLGPDGVVPPRTFVVPGDVLIGKTMNSVETYATPSGELKQRTVKRDQSMILRGTDNCYVDQVVWSVNKDGGRMVNVILRALRIPEVGDKFAFRHGQKGTVGIILDDCDMPFMPNGEIADVIMNVHMWPSRMTIGLLSEMHLGMGAALASQEANGTPFRTDQSFERFGEILKQFNYSPLCQNTVYSGTTGLPIDASVFVGNGYFMRLKHYAEEKGFFRRTGPIQIVTHQPVEGRSHEGGGRFGEMERDVVIAHGSAQFLTETLHDRSDPNISHVCNNCGLLAEEARPPGVHIRGMVLRGREAYCRNCDTGEHVIAVKIPYACKLFQQEIMAMGGAWRLRVTKFDQKKPNDRELLKAYSVMNSDLEKIHNQLQVITVDATDPAEENR